MLLPDFFEGELVLIDVVGNCTLGLGNAVAQLVGSDSFFMVSDGRWLLHWE